MQTPLEWNGNLPPIANSYWASLCVSPTAFSASSVRLWLVRLTHPSKNTFWWTVSSPLVHRLSSDLWLKLLILLFLPFSATWKLYQPHPRHSWHRYSLLFKADPKEDQAGIQESSLLGSPWFAWGFLRFQTSEPPPPSTLGFHRLTHPSIVLLNVENRGAPLCFPPHLSRSCFCLSLEPKSQGQSL